MLEFLFAWWWLGLIESLIIAGVIALVALNAHRIVGDAPQSLAALKSSMGLTVLALIGGYLVVVGVAAWAINAYMGLSGTGVAIMLSVLAFLMVAVQWLFSPYIINIMYRTRDPLPSESWIVGEVEQLARRSGIKPPKVLVSDMTMPNAFAYGSPIAGSYVAVTRGLLRLLPKDEVRAVLAHEVGHLKHRDVTVILALSLVPIAAFFIGRALVWAGILGGGDRRANPAALLAIGAALIAAGFLFQLIVSHFNRLREYYADAHSALITGSPRSLQRALARIHSAYEANPALVEEARSNEMAAMLFIVAPFIELWASPLVDVDYVVERLKHSEVNPVLELFSSHPPIPKRLRFLDRLALRIGGVENY
ncbi:MAG: zinc metalloprotease HtpX [Aeropyrum sp.]|nr:zinc metalloprotease HtpX [Aeropyrum sp.]MCE4616031.1 zinc metalloprotease HtpX [Aeropyrum sp.]